MPVENSQAAGSEAADSEAGGLGSGLGDDFRDALRLVCRTTSSAMQ